MIARAREAGEAATKLGSTTDESHFLARSHTSTFETESVDDAEYGRADQWWSTEPLNYEEESVQLQSFPAGARGVHHYIFYGADDGLLVRVTRAEFLSDAGETERVRVRCAERREHYERQAQNLRSAPEYVVGRHG